jgi:hypothetical protein
MSLVVHKSIHIYLSGALDTEGGEHGETIASAPGNRITISTRTGAKHRALAYRPSANGYGFRLPPAPLSQGPDTLRHRGCHLRSEIQEDTYEDARLAAGRTDTVIAYAVMRDIPVSDTMAIVIY